jgi:hypothetical protein
MDFNWKPLGDTQKYEFSVGLKAPLLKDNFKYDRGKDREYVNY